MAAFPKVYFDTLTKYSSVSPTHCTIGGTGRTSSLQVSLNITATAYEPVGSSGGGFPGFAMGNKAGGVYWETTCNVVGTNSGGVVKAIFQINIAAGSGRAGGSFAAFAGGSLYVGNAQGWVSQGAAQSFSVAPCSRVTQNGDVIACALAWNANQQCNWWIRNLTAGDSWCNNNETPTLTDGVSGAVRFVGSSSTTLYADLFSTNNFTNIIGLMPGVGETYTANFGASPFVGSIPGGFQTIDQLSTPGGMLLLGVGS
jgi:hypothetical protein